MLKSVLVYLITIVPFVLSFQCPDGWNQSTSVSDKCYLIVTTRMMWFEAEAYCQAQAPGSAHLTSIISAYETYNINGKSLFVRLIISASYDYLCPEINGIFTYTGMYRAGLRNAILSGAWYFWLQWGLFVRGNMKKFAGGPLSKRRRSRGAWHLSAKSAWLIRPWVCIVCWMRLGVESVSRGWAKNHGSF
jgi:hypothetical protein